MKQLVAEYYKISMTIAELEKKKEALRATLLEHFKEGVHDVEYQKIVYVVNIKRKTISVLDQQKLKKELPSLYEQYKKQLDQTVLSIKIKGINDEQEEE